MDSAATQPSTGSMRRRCPSRRCRRCPSWRSPGCAICSRRCGSAPPSLPSAASWALPAARARCARRRPPGTRSPRTPTVTTMRSPGGRRTRSTGTSRGPSAPLPRRWERRRAGSVRRDIPCLPRCSRWCGRAAISTTARCCPRRPTTRRKRRPSRCTRSAGGAAAAFWAEPDSCSRGALHTGGAGYASFPSPRCRCSARQ